MGSWTEQVRFKVTERLRLGSDTSCSSNSSKQQELFEGYEDSTDDQTIENNDVQHKIKTRLTPVINEKQADDELDELINETKQKQKAKKNKTSVTKKVGIEDLIAFQRESMQHQKEQNIRFDTMMRRIEERIEKNARKTVISF